MNLTPVQDTNLSLRMVKLEPAKDFEEGVCKTNIDDLYWYNVNEGEFNIKLDIVKQFDILEVSIYNIVSAIYVVKLVGTLCDEVVAWEAKWTGADEHIVSYTWNNGPYYLIYAAQRGYGCFFEEATFNIIANVGGKQYGPRKVTFSMV